MLTLARWQVLCATVILGITVFAASAAMAADELVVTAQDSGRLCVSKAPLEGGKAPLVLELNAHALQWAVVKQDKAEMAERTPVDGGFTYRGALPIAGEKGGRLNFEEQVVLAGETLKASYMIQPEAALSVCGLQISASLDADLYKGATITVTQVEAPAEPAAAAGEPAAGDAAAAAEEPAAEDAAASAEERPAAEDAAAPAEVAKLVTVTLPEEVQQEKVVLFAGLVRKIEVVTADGLPFTITVPKPTFFVIQDVRKWDSATFEIRLALEMKDEGVELPADKAYKAALALKFGAPLAFAAAE